MTISASDTAWREAALEAVSDAVLLMDPRGRVVTCNQACTLLFGWSAAQIIDHDAELIIPDWSRILVSPSAGAPATTTARHMDGSRLPIELMAIAVERDGVVHHLAIVRPAPSRDPAVHASKEAERSFRLLVEGVTDYAIYMLDCDGRVTSWNRGAQHIKQFTAAEILGHHYGEFYPQEARDRGEPESNLEIAREQGRYEATAWRLRKDGSRFWAHVVIEPLRGEHGELIGFAKVTSDITEHRQAEEKTRETQARIHTLLETIVDGVILSDAHGQVLFVNSACERLFLYRAEEIIGRNVKMLMPSGDRDRHDRYIDNYERTGEKKIIGIGRELIGARKDGTTFPFYLSVGEGRQDSTPFYVGIIHDLTERKRTEEQLVQAQKMQTVGQFAGGIAHDFNNLLTVILGNAEFLGDQLKARQDLRSLAEDIGRAGQRGAELTQQLLAFSRRQTLKPVELDCNQLLDSMHKLLRRTLREDIAIDTDFEPALRTAYADRAQLESAIINLAVNARDAMEGGGSLSITTANVLLDDSYRVVNQDVRPGNYVLIAVTDNGAGMPKEVLDRAFEPFYTTKEVGKGSGLGLSMVYGFVKQSNGHVSIYSEPGLGTTVRLYLPALDNGQAAAPEPAEPATSDAAHGEIVLIVEDDPFVRSYAVMCLRSLGYVVIAAVDGREAIQKLLSVADIDVLFTDIVMPGGINGWELAEAALTRRPGLRVLLTSGYALDSIAGRSHGHGEFPILPKPYRKADLARRLRELFDKPDKA